jgi:hypothetical protein
MMEEMKKAIKSMAKKMAGGKEVSEEEMKKAKDRLKGREYNTGNIPKESR